MYCVVLQEEKNLENVTHEQAVATLKSLSGMVTLIVGKSTHSSGTTQQSFSQMNSHSSGIINTIGCGTEAGQSIVDYARSSSSTNSAINAVPALASITTTHSNNVYHNPKNIAFCEAASGEPHQTLRPSPSSNITNTTTTVTNTVNTTNYHNPDVGDILLSSTASRSQSPLSRKLVFLYNFIILFTSELNKTKQERK